MSLVIKFYFISSMLNMFRTLIHPSSVACDFSIVSPHWCSRGYTDTTPKPATPKLPTHIETRTRDQCGDTIEKSQAPDDECINVRNMFSIEEVK